MGSDRTGSAFCRARTPLYGEHPRQVRASAERGLPAELPTSSDRVVRREPIIGSFALDRWKSVASARLPNTGKSVTPEVKE
jgi:hypothetical protein